LKQKELEDCGPEGGIMPRSFTHLFSAIGNCQLRSTNTRFLLRCSFIEIYNEELRDLLATENANDKNKKKLEIKESGG
jgi:kinesin family protein 3/17